MVFWKKLKQTLNYLEGRGWFSSVKLPWALPHNAPWLFLAAWIASKFLETRTEWLRIRTLLKIPDRPMLRVGNINKRRGPGVKSLLLIFHVNWPKDSDILWGRKRRDTSDESGKFERDAAEGLLRCFLCDGARVEVLSRWWTSTNITIKNTV